MIVDLATDTLNESAHDVCIVGSGAAGIALASKLEGSGARILLCEAGGLDHEPETQALYTSEVAGNNFVGVHIGRFRVHGGSTTRWGGQALPLTPLDFEVRHWISQSGWPIRFSEVDRFYAEAQEFLGVGTMNVDDELFRFLKRPQAPFDPALLKHHFSKWSPVPDLRRRFGPHVKVSRNVTLLLHANLTDLNLNPRFTGVEQAVFRSLSGQSVTIRAREFVLCVGGIETARILLSNRKQIANGIGNSSGLVGRYFQDHPAARVGSVRPKKPRHFQKLFNVSQRKGVRYSTRITATRHFQEANRLLNASAFFNFDSPESSSVQSLKRAYAALMRDRQFLSAASNFLTALKRPKEAAYSLSQFALHGEVYTPASEFGLTIMCEQEPQLESRISLSAKKDALGIHRAKVGWEVTDLVRTTLRSTAFAVRDELKRLDLAEVEFDSLLMTDATDWKASVADQYHHMGTARMSVLPESGVVDTDLRVHGVSNLSIASSAVFPTGGHSNPTLTILALTFRIAERLKRNIGRVPEHPKTR